MWSFIYRAGSLDLIFPNNRLLLSQRMYDRDQVANLLKVSNKFFQNTVRKAHEAKTGTDLKVALYQLSIKHHDAESTLILPLLRI